MLFRIGFLINHLISDEIGTMSIPRNISIIVNNLPKISGNFGSDFSLRIHFVKAIRHYTENVQGSQVLTTTTKIWCAIRSNRNSQQGKGTKQVWKIQPA